MLEHRKDAQTPLAISYDAHDSLSLGSNGMSLGSDENLDAQTCNENSASTNDELSVMI